MSTQYEPIPVTLTGVIPPIDIGIVDQGAGGLSPWTQNLVQVGGTAITLGQKTMNLSLPVVIASDQSPIPVTGTITVAQPVNVNIFDSSHNSLNSTSGSLNVDVTNFPAIQPVSQSGTWTVQQGSPPWSQNLVQVGGSAISLGQKTMAASVPVVIASDQSPIPVTGSFFITYDTNYGTVGANTLRTASQIGNSTGAAAFGAGTTSAQVLRVVLPTDQTAIPVTQSGSWNILNITGTISLPTGASTSALQTAGNASLVSILANQTNGTQETQVTNFPAIQPVSGTVTAKIEDTAGNALTSTSGSLNVNVTDFPSVQAVSQSGTWTVQPGNTANTTPWLVTDSSDGPVTPGAVATKSSLQGGQYNTSLPTLTNTQQSALQIDSSGRLIISPLSSSSTVTVSNFPTTVDTNYGAVGASTIRTASQIGNSTGAAAFGAGTTTAQVLRVVLPTDQTAIPASQSGTWTVQPGNTANTTPWLVKGNDGTNSWTIKPASTATVVTDTSLVVALSPNSSLPTGTNTIGAVTIASLASSTSAVTRVNSSATNVSLLASNSSRKAAYFYNESTQIAYVKLGTTASLTSYTVQMAPLSFMAIDSDPVYTGEVDALWSAANGAMQVTELT